MSLKENLKKQKESLVNLECLTRITSKVSTLSETCIMGGVFNTIKENQKQSVTIQDRFMWKILYHGGTLFGRATDDLQSLVKTVVGLMVSCMFGGATFISNK